MKIVCPKNDLVHEKTNYDKIDNNDFSIGTKKFTTFPSALYPVYPWLYCQRDRIILSS